MASIFDYLCNANLAYAGKSPNIPKESFEQIFEFTTGKRRCLHVQQIRSSSDQVACFNQQQNERGGPNGAKSSRNPSRVARHGEKNGYY